jgi:murein DD-endopeptidase / murein LD-carboxypeptidase
MIVFASCRTTNHIAKNPKPGNTSSERTFYSEYSKKLGIGLTGIEDRMLIREVSNWIGTTYKYAGNTQNGTDCSGFTSAVYQKVYNIGLYRSSADQVRNTDPVDKKDLKCGDLVFFKIHGDKVSHVGIYIADNKFVHASNRRGVVVDDLSESYYSKYYFSAGRVKLSTGNK